MRAALAQLREFVRELGRAAAADQLRQLAAQLAFWSLLALFPFLIFLLTIVAYVPLHGLDEELLEIGYHVMPDQAAQLLEHTLSEIVGRQRGWLLVGSLVGAVWSASTAVLSAAQALNRAHRVEERRPWWRVRLLALGLTIAGAVQLVVAGVGLAVGPEVVAWGLAWFGLDGAFHRAWALLRWPTVVLDLLFMLACVYHFLPAARTRFRVLSPGGIVAMGLWLGVSLAFKLYVAHFGDYARTYGALGGAVVLIMWLYLSALAVLVGGEINALLARRRRPG